MIHSKMMFMTQQTNPKLQESNKIITFFDSLEKEILEKLNQQRKNILMKYDNIFENTANILDLYNEISSFGDLKEIIQNKQINDF